MNVKRVFCCFSVLLMLSTPKLFAQYAFYNGNYYDNDVTYEVGLSLNAMNCLTDLGGGKGIGKKFIKDLNLKNTQISGGVSFGVMYQNKIGLRLEYTYGTVRAADSMLKGVTDDAKYRYIRNLNFKSNINELSLLAEIHPLEIFIDYLGEDKDPPRFSPYLLGGIGYFAFNPQGYYKGKWYDLQPLHTEGQGFKQYTDRPNYKLQQLNIPFGLGVRWDFNPVLNLKLEYLYRKLNTDYLDDVSTTYIDPSLYLDPVNISSSKSATAILMNNRQIIPAEKIPGGQRGNPKNKDAYFTMNLKLCLILGRGRIR